jgi:hypothetical protein
MNIFYLHKDPKKAAEYHVDKHCVKMILESAQLLSTAHRLLDGLGPAKIKSPTSNRMITRYWIPDERETLLYNATHVNHPSAKWCRASDKNYDWLWKLMRELCTEYTYRYEKIHKCEGSGLLDKLQELPKNIPIGSFTDPTPAMPNQYKVLGDGVQSYRNYYNGEKQRMFSWKKRQVPEFINKTTRENYANI